MTASFRNSKRSEVSSCRLMGVLVVSFVRDPTEAMARFNRNASPIGSAK